MEFGENRLLGALVTHNIIFVALILRLPCGFQMTETGRNHEHTNLSAIRQSRKGGDEELPVARRKREERISSGSSPEIPPT